MVLERVENCLCFSCSNLMMLFIMIMRERKETFCGIMDYNFLPESFFSPGENPPTSKSKSLEERFSENLNCKSFSTLLDCSLTIHF